MLKKRVSAKEAAADIRAGMDDAAFMAKYNLSSEGLQSLIDKLVHAGFIDLGEVENRLPGILGAVTVSESATSRTGGGTENGLGQLKKQSSPLVNAQEAARDVRLGMNDQALMEKYRLTFNGLQSLFNKLMSAGLVTQSDLTRRVRFDVDHTVDLREERLSFKDALRELGLEEHGATRAAMKALVERPVAVQPGVNGFAAPEATAPDKKGRESLGNSLLEARLKAGQSEPTWYDNHAVLGLLLLSLFPLGFYGLYRNVALSYRVKAVVLLAWVGLATAFSFVLKEMI